MLNRLRGAAGVALMDVMITVAVGATVSAIAVPSATRAMDAIHLNGSARAIERALQTAKMKSLASNKRLRVRFNCPSARQYRLIEFTGVPSTDTATNRCDETAFPSPGVVDVNRATPEHDGPVLTLDAGVTVAGSDVEFRANGTAYLLVQDVVSAMDESVTITVTKDAAASARVTVNGLGKIQLQ